MRALPIILIVLGVATIILILTQIFPEFGDGMYALAKNLFFERWN
jgi:hypothetical protein